MITRVGSPDALLRTTTYKIISNVENDQQNTPNMLAVSRARQPAGEERMEEEEEEEEEVIQDVVLHILLNKREMSKIGSFLPPHHDPDTCHLLVQNSLQPDGERSTGVVTVAGGDGGVRVSVRCGGVSGWCSEAAACRCIRCSRLHFAKELLR